MTSTGNSSERQRRLLETEDGRYYAIDVFGTGLAAIATEEEVGKNVVGFGLPSGPALFLHLAHNAFSAYEDIDVEKLFDQHLQGIWPDDQKPLFDFFEQFAAHVIFSFTALESFANEVIPDEYRYTVKRGKKGQLLVYSRADIERYVSLSEKLAQVLPNALGIASPKGTHVWRDYRNLKEIRDRIVHLKTAEKSRTGPKIRTIWGDMLRDSKESYCATAHKLMGHFEPVVANRRWYKEYPYTR